MSGDYSNPIKLEEICIQVAYSDKSARSVQDAALSIEEQTKRYAPFFREIEAQSKKQEPMLRRLAEYIRRIPETLQHDREVDLILAKNGWYIDPEIPADEPFELAKQFEAGNSTQANEALSNHYDSRLDEIEKSLCDSFPERARVLHGAFDAHRRKEYGLAIPVFLAQADGICVKNTQTPLYGKRNGKTRLSLRLLLDDTSFLACSLAAITQPMTISENTHGRTVFFDLLNRHAVMHGLSVDYDTRVNSCRAISLLVFVAWILQEKTTKAYLTKTAQNKLGRNKRN